MNKEKNMVNKVYSIEEITDPGDLEKIKEIWDSLASQQGIYMPFLCFSWFKIWFSHFLRDHRLLILLLCREGEILAIAPFMITGERHKGVRVRKIELIGNVYSPIRYFILGSADEKEKEKNLSYIFTFLRERYRGWTILDLNAIPEEDNCFNTLKLAVEKAHLEHSESFCFGDWYLNDIEGSGEEYFLRVPKRITKDISYNQRRLQRMGNYEFRLISNQEIDRYMDFYYEVYSKSWQKEERIGPTFHRDLAKMAGEKGWLRLGFLFCENAPIASQLWISCNGTAFIMKTVYDQDYKKYSPGKVLTAEMMKYVIDIDKVKVVDYLHGDESYKEDWAPKRRERKRLLAFNNNLRGRYIGFFSKKIEPTFNRYKYLRKMKEIMRRLAGFDGRLG